MVIKCKLCKKIIVKYEIDLEDSVYVTYEDNTRIDYICNVCAKQIASKVVEGFHS